MTSKYATPGAIARTGFTIVELLIVVVVIAILAAVSTVVYAGVQQRARDSVNDSNVRQLIKGVEMHYAETGQYPGVSGIDYDSTSEFWQFGSRFVTEYTKTRELYMHPSAPRWLATSVIYGNHEAYGEDGWVEDTRGSGWHWVETEIPGGYASWDDFYDAAWESQQDYIENNPAPAESASDAVWTAYVDGYYAENPQFSCLRENTCEEGGEWVEGEHGEYREVKKEWVYYVTPLLTGEHAPCMNYSNISVTGYEIAYWSETKSDWVSVSTGEGEPGVACFT